MLISVIRQLPIPEDSLNEQGKIKNNFVSRNILYIQINGLVAKKLKKTPQTSKTPSQIWIPKKKKKTFTESEELLMFLFLHRLQMALAKNSFHIQK